MALSFGLPSLVLLLGLVDDLRSRKIHNSLIIVLAIIVLVSLSISLQWSDFERGLLGMGMAVALCLPLFLTRVLGGGDLKLLVVFGLSTDWNTVLWVIVYSLFWGALLGVFRALLKGSALSLFTNIFGILSGKVKSDSVSLHKIPYTVALIFAWLTHLSLVWR